MYLCSYIVCFERLALCLLSQFNDLLHDHAGDVDGSDVDREVMTIREQVAEGSGGKGGGRSRWVEMEGKYKVIEWSGWLCSGTTHVCCLSQQTNTHTHTKR